MKALLLYAPLNESLPMRAILFSRESAIGILYGVPYYTNDTDFPVIQRALALVFSFRRLGESKVAKLDRPLYNFTTVHHCWTYKIQDETVY